MIDATKKGTEEQKLTDPVCGMSVTKDSQFHLQHKDKAI